ncbi:MAG: hypothetical protein KTR30_12880 [Saprospiraceae bacterium]|nr:hypothetical protein [Saprospiraceae bacterium]
MKRSIFILFSILLFASCNRDRFKTYSYENYAYQHQTVAIIPVTTYTSGRIPRDISDEQIEMIEEAESQAFQIELYNQLIRRSGRNANNINIDFQHFATTNDKLEEAGIGLRESWQRPPEELAELLGVDAVVITNVEKERYLTDLESFGLSVLNSIAWVFSDGWWPLYGQNRTSDVLVSCAIVDGQSGTVIWSTNRTCPTSWNRPHNEVVRSITRTISRRFPYRMGN